MNKRRRKRNVKSRTASRSCRISETCGQTDISKFLVRQPENSQLSCISELNELSGVPSVDNAVLPGCTSVPSAYKTSKSINQESCNNLSLSKYPSDFKENCIKSVKDCNDHTSHIPNMMNNRHLNSITAKKNNKKQMILSLNHRLTDYYPVRRSNRRTLSIAKKERQIIVEDAILSGKEEGFEVKEFPGKGRGVITKKPIKRGEFVLEYYGELIDYEEAKKRETIYATKENTGCYMYYFKFMNERFCIDATKETHRLGRLVNHSKKGNLKTVPFFIKDCPHLVFFAGRDIEPGEELSYDYGDRRKIAIESHPWLAF